MSLKSTVEAVAKNGEMRKKEAKELLTFIGDLISREVFDGRDFVVPGVGKFVLKKVNARPARTIRNPRTGEQVAVEARPAYLTVAFKPLKTLRNPLN